MSLCRRGGRAHSGAPGAGRRSSPRPPSSTPAQAGRRFTRCSLHVLAHSLACSSAATTTNSSGAGRCRALCAACRDIRPCELPSDMLTRAQSAPVCTSQVSWPGVQALPSATMETNDFSAGMRRTEVCAVPACRQLVSNKRCCCGRGGVWSALDEDHVQHPAWHPSMHTVTPGPCRCGAAGARGTSGMCSGTGPRQQICGAHDDWSLGVPAILSELLAQAVLHAERHVGHYLTGRLMCRPNALQVLHERCGDELSAGSGSAFCMT